MAELNVIYQQLKQLATSNNKLVLAYSGGVDSELLAYALSQYQQQHPQQAILLVHVHHGLSANADCWLEHCQRRAQHYGLPIETEKVQVIKQARESLEAVARDLRYQAILKHLNAGDVLLTAHHQDDQLETLLLALKRGQGPKGLAAMGALQPIQQAEHLHADSNQTRWHARPMLDLSKDEVEQLANTYSLEHIEDESNQDEQFDRNFLRQSVIPLLKQRWPSIAQTSSRSAKLCHEYQQLVDLEVTQRLPECLASSTQLARTEIAGLYIPRLLALPELWQRQIVRGFIEHMGLNAPSLAQLVQILSQLNAAADAQIDIHCSDYHVKRFADVLYLLPALKRSAVKSKAADQEQPSQKRSMNLLQSKQVQDLSAALQQLVGGDVSEVEFDFGQHRFQACVGLQGVRLALPTETQRLTVQYQAKGSIKCQPVFANHQRHKPRELKKLWQECAIPPWQRQQIPLIFYNDTLVAAMGLWIDKQFIAQGDEAGICMPLMD